MKDYPNETQLQLKTTFMECDINGRRPQWKITSMEDLKERQPQRETTSKGEALKGTQPQREMTSMADVLNARRPQLKNC